MTSVPPTQPPAAPETDVRLTEAERKSLWRVIAGVRDGAARLPNDADTEDIIDAILDSGWIYRLVAERVRVVEGERDALRIDLATCERVANGIEDRAEAAEAAHRALRAAVEALADEWEADFMAYRHDNPGHLRLRALLAGGEER